MFVVCPAIARAVTASNRCMVSKYTALIGVLTMASGIRKNATKHIKDIILFTLLAG